MKNRNSYTRAVLFGDSAEFFNTYGQILKDVSPFCTTEWTYNKNGTIATRSDTNGIHCCYDYKAGMVIESFGDSVITYPIPINWR